jgi:hypothetical protein
MQVLVEKPSIKGASIEDVKKESEKQMHMCDAPHGLSERYVVERYRTLRELFINMKVKDKKNCFTP